MSAELNLSKVSVSYTALELARALGDEAHIAKALERYNKDLEAFMKDIEKDNSLLEQLAKHDDPLCGLDEAGKIKFWEILRGVHPTLRE